MRSRFPVGAIALCILLSGAGSLMLEVVWSRLLKLVFGSTTLAITTILVAYMLGLGLGGLFGGHLATRIKGHVRAYGLIELAVGAYALCVPSILDLYPWLDRAVLAQLSFWPAAFLRFALVLVVLLLPTLMMGATLPILVAGLVQRRDDIARRVGLLYGVNTLGAVSGVLLATFVLFEAIGVRWTNFTGATLDLLVGAFAVFVLAPALGEASDEPQPEQREVAPTARWSLPLLAYGFVGLTALVFEVAWTRMLSLVLGSSVYAFATMLASFLAGIALGSLIGRMWLDRIKRPLAVYGAGICLLGVSALATLLAMRALPDFFLTLVESQGISGAQLVRIGLLFSFGVMLAPTLVLGALFPLAVRAAAGPGRPAATVVGDVYFLNTIGSAAGAFLAGFVLIPTLGTLRTTTLAITVDLVVGGALLLAYARSVGWLTPLAIASLGGALWISFAPPAFDVEDFANGAFYRPEGRLAFGLEPEPMIGVPGAEMLFYKEGINATVSIHRPDGGLEAGGVHMKLNGKTDASIADMSTQILSGHLPILFGARPERVLVIGYASGVTTGSAALHELERIDVAEIEPAVIEAARFFDEVNNRPLERDDVHKIEDDGRALLARTDDTYDVIISEPSNPWITGCSNLFTTEFFELVESRLNPGGRLLQWIQLYNMRPAGLSSILAALHESFGYAYGFLSDSASGDLLLIATREPLTARDLPIWEDLTDAVQDDLRREGIHSTADLWSLFTLTPDELARLASEAPEMNTDDSMFVELDAPWHLYDDTEETSKAIWTNARGILPMLEGADVSDELLGEIALAYVHRRNFPPIARMLAENVAATRADVLTLSAYQAWVMLDDDPEALPRALALLNSACQAKPDVWALHFLRADLLFQSRRYQEALADTNVALALRPDHIEVLHLRAKIYGSLGLNAEGRAEFERLLQTPLVVSDPYAYVEAAFLAAQEKDYERAISELETYVELYPYSPREWQVLGQYYEAAGRTERVLFAQGNAGLARKNKILEIHRAARWHERQGRIQEAIETLEYLRSVDPSYLPGIADLERLRGSS